MLAVDDEILRREQRHPVFGGEFFGAGSDEHHMLAFLEDEAGEANWVAHAFDGCYCAGFQRRSVHDNSVELNASLAIQMRADTGVEGRVVLKNHDGSFYGVERSAAC